MARRQHRLLDAWVVTTHYAAEGLAAPNCQLGTATDNENLNTCPGAVVSALVIAYWCQCDTRVLASATPCSIIELL